jgi:hypothetical protein
LIPSRLFFALDLKAGVVRLGGGLPGELYALTCSGAVEAGKLDGELVAVAGEDELAESISECVRTFSSDS